MMERAPFTELIAATGAMLALAGCGKSPAEPRRMESFAELKAKQDRDFAASPDVQLPELRERLHALGVTDANMRQAADDYHEPILLIDLGRAEFARIDKRALAKLQLDSRYRFRLTNPMLIREFAQYSVAENHAREKAIALKELAEKGEMERIPRYRAGLPMTAYARALEHYCGYGPGEALRVIDGHWLEYNNKMTSDSAVAAANGQSYAPFACIKRIVYATDLGPHFIGNRGRQGAIN